MTVALRPFSLQRMVGAVEKVRERLLRAARALQDNGILYAVAGGNAVAAWVTRVDEAAVRNTQDVNILIRRTDLETVKTALEQVGFVYRHAASIDMFLDGPRAKARDAVHIIFAGEKVRPDEPAANPDVTESEPADEYQILTLDALVRIKLTAFRDKDRVHLRDFLDVGLIDATWLERLPLALGQRLQQLLDTPNGWKFHVPEGVSPWPSTPRPACKSSTTLAAGSRKPPSMTSKRCRIAANRSSSSTCARKASLPRIICPVRFTWARE